MIAKKTHIKSWTIFWFFCPKEQNIKEIVSSLKKVGASKKVLLRAEEKLFADNKNEGFTYSNIVERKSVVVVGRASSGSEFMNSFSHELRHLVDDISSYYGMSDRGEEVAYLTGDIANSVSGVVCELSCDCCRAKKYD